MRIKTRAYSCLTLRNFVMRFRLDSVHEVRELHRVLYEENGDIVADDVPVTLVSVELYSKTTNIADGILTLLCEYMRMY